MSGWYGNQTDASARNESRASRPVQCVLGAARPLCQPAHQRRQDPHLFQQPRPGQDIQGCFARIFCRDERGLYIVTNYVLYLGISSYSYDSLINKET